MQAENRSTNLYADVQNGGRCVVGRKETPCHLLDVSVEEVWKADDGVEVGDAEWDAFIYLFVVEGVWRACLECC